jgi:hypothetical protein
LCYHLCGKHKTVFVCLQLHKISLKRSQTCWYTPVIPALQRLKQEDCKFKASLCYTVKAYLRPPHKKKKSLKGYVKTNKRGTAVAHACKPSYSGGRDGGWGRNFSLKTASKELVRPPSQPIARCVGMCLSSHLFRKCK